MFQRVLLLAIVLCSLLVAALLLVISFVGIEGEPGSRPVTEVLPEWTDGALDDLSEYHSSVNGYTIRFPEDWTQSPTSIDLGETSTDVFYALSAGEDAGIAPTLSITSESLPPGTTSEDYLASRLRFLDGVQTEASEPESIEIDGVQGYLVDYKGFSHNYPVEVSSVVLAKGQQGWEFTFAVPEGQRSQYRPLLGVLLSSVTIP
jgi:hypothetical protein